MSQVKKTTREIAPLFAESDPPIYADQITRVVLEGLSFDRFGKSTRISIPKKNLMEINPYETTKEDLAEAYEDLYEGLRVMACGEGGKTIQGGVYNFRIRPPEGEEDDEDEDKTTTVVQAPQSNRSEMKFMADVFGKQLEMANQRGNEGINLALAMMQRGNTAGDQAVIDTLKSQVKMLEAQLDDARRSYRDDLNKRDKDLEDMRVNYRDEVERRRREFDTERSRYERDLDERRTRYDRETTDLRVRLEKEITEGRSKYERELVDMRLKYEKRLEEHEKRIAELQRENFELRRELAEIPDESEKQAPPQADGVLGQLTAAAPLFMPVLEKMMSAPSVPPQTLQQPMQQMQPMPAPPAVPTIHYPPVPAWEPVQTEPSMQPEPAVVAIESPTEEPQADPDELEESDDETDYDETEASDEDELDEAVGS